MRALPLATPSSTAYAGRFAAFAEACAETCAREAASRLLRRCGLEPMLLRCRKVELLQARGEVLGPAAEAISRETLSAALRAFYSALFQDPAPDLDAIAPDARRAEAKALCAKILAHAHASVYALAGRRSHGRLRRDGLWCIRRTGRGCCWAMAKFSEPYVLGGLAGAVRPRFEGVLQ